MKSFLTKIWQLLPLTKHIQLTIMRFTQDEFLIGVTGVILNNNNEILVVNHSYRDGEHWSLPGGYMKGKEHPREGLAREIEEETGYIVRIDEETRIRTDRETPRLDISLVGRHIGGAFSPSHEVKDARFFTFDTLPLLSQNQLMLIKEVLEKKTKKTITESSTTFFTKLGRMLKLSVKQSKEEFRPISQEPKETLRPQK